MVVYGKNFKKIQFENIDELFDALNGPDKFRIMMKNTDVLTSFTKNDDGSIQSIVTNADGQELFSHKLVPDAETDITAPDGNKLKAFCQIKDNAIETVLSFPDGAKIHMDRVFKGDIFKFIMHKEGVDLKAVITYQVV